MQLFQQGSLGRKILAIFSLASVTIACTPNEEVWTGRDRNPIQVVCGKACRTIIFPNATEPRLCKTDCRYHYQANILSTRLTPEAREEIRRYVHHYPRRHRIFVSPCATNPRNPIYNEQRIDAVKDEIRRLGYTPVRLKATLPADLTTTNCVNLVRGKLYLYVQNCPNNTVTPSVNNIGTSFGCTTNWNLAHMIVNPWNLLALPGDNGTEGSRVAIGELNYREGKHSKLDMESSS